MGEVGRLPPGGVQVVKVFTFPWGRRCLKFPFSFSPGGGVLMRAGGKEIVAEKFEYDPIISCGWCIFDLYEE